MSREYVFVGARSHVGSRKFSWLLQNLHSRASVLCGDRVLRGRSTAPCPAAQGPRSSNRQRPDSGAPVLAGPNGFIRKTCLSGQEEENCPGVRTAVRIRQGGGMQAGKQGRQVLWAAALGPPAVANARLSRLRSHRGFPSAGTACFRLTIEHGTITIATRVCRRGSAPRRLHHLHRCRHQRKKGWIVRRRPKGQR